MGMEKNAGVERSIIAVKNELIVHRYVDKIANFKSFVSHFQNYIPDCFEKFFLLFYKKLVDTMR